MNPHPSLHSALAGRKTSLDGCHSFLASLMAMPPLPFCTSTHHDRSRPSNSAVLTVKALHDAGAAIFMRSPHGCGILAGPSLELEGFRTEMSVAKTKGIYSQSRSETSRRAWETRTARKVAAAAEIYLAFVWNVYFLIQLNLFGG
jgi:hypothetical protein